MSNAGQSPQGLAPYLGFLLVSSLAVIGGIAFGVFGSGVTPKADPSTASATRVDTRNKASRSGSPQRASSATRAGDGESEKTGEDQDAKRKEDMSQGAQGASVPAIATFGAGCFWCVEAVLERLDGVHDVVSGYMGGVVEDPTYSDVCTGQTGHAEVVQVHFDASRISYDALLEWFWKLHDPTTLNRQGADTGTQYRSAIFVHDEEQRRAAEASRTAHAKDFQSPIVTEITDASTFWVAEVDHQDYYRLNPNAGYCRAVIAPKLEKLDSKKR